MVRLNPLYPDSASSIGEIKDVEVSYLSDEDTVRSDIIEVHESVADDIRAFFEEALQQTFYIEKVSQSSEFGWDDDVLMDKNITSGYNFRFIKNTQTPSLHAKGLAFDVNPRLNPYIRYEVDSVETDPPGALHDPSQPGTLYEGHPLVDFMKDRGWEWGGDWTPEYGAIDYQHFQKK